MYDFDEEIERKNSDCVKYDDLNKYFGYEDLQPLWVADMDFRVCLEINEAISKRVKQGIYGYPKQSDKLFTLIQKWMKKRHNFNINTADITMLNGVVPAYSAAIEAFSQEGDEIIVQTPVYFPLFKSISANNRVIVINPLKEKNGYYTMDLEHFKSIITPKTKILTLCSPHNPVGRVWDKKELEDIAKICIEHGIKIISDEIHSDLVFKTFTPLASISSLIADITLTLNSAGKAFNIAGLNCAYSICSNKQMKILFDKVIQKREINSVNIFGLIALEVAYEFGENWLEELLSYLKTNIQFTKNYLAKTKIDFLVPEATYLLWLDFKAFEISHQSVKNKLLKESKIALNDGVIFGKEGQLYFRLNIATQKKKLELALKSIVKTFS